MEVKEVQQLFKIVRDFFGYKAKNITYDIKRKEVSCLLYDSFFFECNINGRYGMYGRGINFGGYIVTSLLGEETPLNKDKKSICESLQNVDEYCRARLPDKFLNAYAKAYKKRFKIFKL